MFNKERVKSYNWQNVAVFIQDKLTPILNVTNIQFIIITLTVVVPAVHLIPAVIKMEMRQSAKEQQINEMLALFSWRLP